MTTEENVGAKANTREVARFTFLHFLNDLHSTSLPTIIPMLVSSIGISLSQAGLLNALFGLNNIFLQPISGYFADRQRRPWFAIWGPMFSICGACLLPLAPSYAFAFLLVGLMSTGTATFHPQGTGRTGAASDGGNLAFYLSLFSASGNLGSAVGPLYVVFMISLLGKPLFPLMIIPGFLICWYIWRNAAHSVSNCGSARHGNADIREFIGTIRSILHEIGGIVLTAGVRDATYQCIKLFLPMYIIMKGGTITEGGIYLFAVTMSATLSGIVGGKLAGLLGDDKIMFWSITLSPFFILLGLFSSGSLSIFFMMVGFAVLQSNAPVATAIAQKRCPGARSMASSFAMGVAWGIANLFATPVGFAADSIGLETTLRIVAFLPWTVTACWLCKKFLGKRSVPANKC